jgi:hypothetical protein
MRLDEFGNASLLPCGESASRTRLRIQPIEGKPRPNKMALDLALQRTAIKHTSSSFVLRSNPRSRKPRNARQVAGSSTMVIDCETDADRCERCDVIKRCVICAVAHTHKTRLRDFMKLIRTFARFCLPFVQRHSIAKETPYSRALDNFTSSESRTCAKTK